MKKIYLPTRWLVIIGLICISTFLLQDRGGIQLADDKSRLSESEPLSSLTVGDSTASTHPEQAAAELASLDDSELTLVSSSGSVKPLAVESIPAVVTPQTICIKGLKASESNVHIAVFETPAAFPKAELSPLRLVVSTVQEQVIFPMQLPTNKPIAIAVFQDLDGDGKLSKNQIGAPIEPYGFSNKARGMFGPPSFGQAAITISQVGNYDRPLEIQVR